ncbi:MAG: DUF2029 domain-containing protein [Scytolyngbya sp. HA4215-MV1]|nr:DUF2029 domain-containing protein [Scytolyngbya sp. HA4215-MV1]
MEKLSRYWQKLTPLTRNLLLFTVFNIFISSILLMLVFATRWKDTGLYHTLVEFVTFHQNSDSWRTMRAALKAPKIYSVFFDQGLKFQYPPTSLLIIKFIPQSWLLSVISWILTIVNVVFCVKIFQMSLAWHTVQTLDRSPPSKAETTLQIFILCCLGFTFYPIMKAFSLGQVQTWINAAFAITVWAWMTQKKVLAGFLTGLTCCLKPQSFLLVLWGVLRQQWQFTIAAIATLSVVFLCSISLFGFANHLDYLKVLSFISKHGESLFANHSVNGVLNRLLFNGDNLTWNSKTFAPYHPVVYFGTLISSLFFVITSLIPPKSREAYGGTIDLSTLALSATIASPVVWEHHYGILLPIYAFLLPCLIQRPVFGKFTLPYLCLSYILTSNHFEFTDFFAPIPILNILQSYRLIGGLMVLVCLHRLRSGRALAQKTEDLSRDHLDLSSN